MQDIEYIDFPKKENTIKIKIYEEMDSCIIVVAEDEMPYYKLNTGKHIIVE